MEGIRPLTTPQQRLLQNLLACHVSNDSTLQALWDEIRGTSANEYLGRDLNDTLAIINRTLKPTFGLEVRSVALALGTSSTGLSNGNDENGNGNSGPTLYHAIVNCQADKVSKAASNPQMTKNPHELALFRLIIERLVERSSQQNEAEAEADLDEEDNDNNNNDGSARKRRRGAGTRGTGCQAALSDMDMINMRTELGGAHAGKLSIEQVQNALELFVSQGWFVTAANPNAQQNQNQNQNRTPKKKKTKTRYLQLGPRSYLEFSDFLRKAGMDKQQLPQFLVHA